MTDLNEMTVQEKTAFIQSKLTGYTVLERRNNNQFLGWYVENKFEGFWAPIQSMFSMSVATIDESLTNITRLASTGSINKKLASLSRAVKKITGRNPIIFDVIAH